MTWQLHVTSVLGRRPVTVTDTVLDRTLTKWELHEGRWLRVQTARMPSGRWVTTVSAGLPDAEHDTRVIMSHPDEPDGVTVLTLVSAVVPGLLWPQRIVLGIQQDPPPEAWKPSMLTLPTEEPTDG